MGELPSSGTLWLCAEEEKGIDGCYGWMKVNQWMHHCGVNTPDAGSSPSLSPSVSLVESRDSCEHESDAVGNEVNMILLVMTIATGLTAQAHPHDLFHFLT